MKTMTNEKLCIFLRGINVNGVKIKMQELKEAFYKMGFNEVQTVLATGNVIIELNEDTLKLNLKEYIETGLGRTFNYNSHVFIRSMNEINKIYNESKLLNLPVNHHLYVLLCESPETVKELETLFAAVSHSEGESIKPLKTDLFWIIAKGETLSSDFGSMVLGNKKYKEKLTSRNINTIERIFH
jgi:uncharacterized protein (DUF1697 family)